MFYLLVPVSSQVPQRLGLIAGRGAYPLVFAECARKAGVDELFVIAFKGETDRAIEKHASVVRWIRVGELESLLVNLKEAGIVQAVMAGQLAPKHLFRVRLDAQMKELLARLKTRNAETIFGAVADELKAIGIELLPASRFMESAMPVAGQLSRRGPTDREHADMELGLHVAKVTSGLDIGQTVVVKEGTILAVEAFEGTDEAIKRAAKLAGAGLVVVKTAKAGHDMRFDIPVIGVHTLQLLGKLRAAALFVDAGQTILLEREKVIRLADDCDICVVAVDASGIQGAS
jgi:DUF1009 family protein|tara:strand:- start:623 stop:1486 length:864 start_codon:yes stop_codon:yes gene_type:complete